MPLSTPTRHGRAPPPPHEIAAQSVPTCLARQPKWHPETPQGQSAPGGLVSHTQQLRHLWGGKLVSRTRTAVLSDTPDSDCRGSAHWHRVPWPVRGPALPPPATHASEAAPRVLTDPLPARTIFSPDARSSSSLPSAVGKRSTGSARPSPDSLGLLHRETPRRVESARGRPGSAPGREQPVAGPRVPARAVHQGRRTGPAFPRPSASSMTVTPGARHNCHDNHPRRLRRRRVIFECSAGHLVLLAGKHVPLTGVPSSRGGPWRARLAVCTAPSWAGGCPRPALPVPDLR